jgi:hypothetical protein
MALKMVELAEQAKEQLAQMTGFKPFAIVGSYKDEEGWHITVDVVELTRIPEATDVIGTYVALLDENGDMMKFEKKRSRLRGDSYEEEEE